jgi:ectoine hydroxylase-related dioxygenase (phytanoyl-CoA dioxygenase family)
MCPSARRQIPGVSESWGWRMIRDGLVMKSMTAADLNRLGNGNIATGIDSAPDGSPSNVQGYEVTAELDYRGRITTDCARQLCDSLDENGFVIVPLALSEAEADTGRGLIDAVLADPERAQAAFASQTDNHYRRRDFCSLPSTPEVIAFASLICQRLRPALEEYCGHSRAILEITTLTSYQGCSHQYFHHDPYGAISVFVAVDDLSPEQGGTVFVPGTHRYGGAQMRHGGKAFELTELFRIRSNLGVLVHNLRKIWSMRSLGQPQLGPGEFLDRVFSRRQDDHQPNLLRFALGKTYQFRLTMLNPLNLWRMFKYRRELRQFSVIPTSPKKGTVILYRSDILHAGADNCSTRPRHLFSLSIARDRVVLAHWQRGYAPHASLLARPLSFGKLVNQKRPCRDPMSASQ